MSGVLANTSTTRAMPWGVHEPTVHALPDKDTMPHATLPTWQVPLLKAQHVCSACTA